MRKPSQIDARPRQDTPQDLVSRLLSTVRGQFCADMPAGDWYAHQHFIRRNVILWPAKFMSGKGFTLPAARYESIMREVFQTIILKGQTGAVKFWPGYLMKCIQDHWKHHWEDYYAEAKSARHLVTAALLACQHVEPADKTVDALALAHQVLTQKRRKSSSPKPARQLGLLGL